MLSRIMALALVGLLLTTSQAQPKKADVKADSKKQQQTKQEGVPAPEAAGSESQGTDSLLQMIMGSGTTGILFMLVLGLFSIVGASVAVERGFNTRRARILPPEYVDRLEQVSGTASPSEEQLSELCDTDCPIGVIVQAGFERRGGTLSEIEKAMEDAAARELAELRTRMRPLTTVGAVAPLVGLLGTVVGMIIAFHTASQAGLGKAELLAKGIYMALITTAGGLSVAIPAMLLAAFFTGRVERMFREMDRLLAPVVNWLVGLGGGTRQPAPTTPTAARPTNPITTSTPTKPTAAPKTTPRPTSEPQPTTTAKSKPATEKVETKKPEPVAEVAEQEPAEKAEPKEATQEEPAQQKTPGRQPPKRTSSHNPIKI